MNGAHQLQMWTMRMRASAPLLGSTPDQGFIYLFIYFYSFMPLTTSQYTPLQRVSAFTRRRWATDESGAHSRNRSSRDSNPGTATMASKRVTTELTGPMTSSLTSSLPPQYGLRLMLSPDLDEYIPAVTPGQGVRVGGP